MMISGLGNVRIEFSGRISKDEKNRFQRILGRDLSLSQVVKLLALLDYTLAFDYGWEDENPDNKALTVLVGGAAAPLLTIWINFSDLKKAYPQIIPVARFIDFLPSQNDFELEFEEDRSAMDDYLESLGVTFDNRLYADTVPSSRMIELILSFVFALGRVELSSAKNEILDDFEEDLEGKLPYWLSCELHTVDRSKHPSRSMLVDSYYTYL